MVCSLFQQSYLPKEEEFCQCVSVWWKTTEMLIFMYHFALHVLQLPVRTWRRVAEALVVVLAPNINITAPSERRSAMLYLHLLRTKLQNCFWTGWKHSQHFKKTRTNWGKLGIIAGGTHLNPLQGKVKCQRNKWSNVFCCVCISLSKTALECVQLQDKFIQNQKFRPKLRPIKSNLLLDSMDILEIKHHHWPLAFVVTLFIYFFFLFIIYCRLDQQQGCHNDDNRLKNKWTNWMLRQKMSVSSFKHQQPTTCACRWKGKSERNRVRGCCVVWFRVSGIEEKRPGRTESGMRTSERQSALDVLETKAEWDVLDRGWTVSMWVERRCWCWNWRRRLTDAWIDKGRQIDR